jgi:hypothetical protein
MNTFKLCVCLTFFLLLWGCNISSRNNFPKTEKDLQQLPIDSGTIIQNNIEYDTSLIKVLDTMITVASLRAIDKNPFASVSLDLPLKSDSILYGTYWIGVGKQAINEYALIEQETPVEWSKPGVSVPIGAFALGKPVSLPENIPEAVCIGIGKQSKRQEALRRLRCDEKLEIKSIQEKFDLPADENEKLFLWVINSDAVNFYEINIKFIATKVKIRKK